jgi:hypothetical protein
LEHTEFSTLLKKSKLDYYLLDTENTSTNNKQVNGQGFLEKRNWKKPANSQPPHRQSQQTKKQQLQATQHTKGAPTSCPHPHQTNPHLKTKKHKQNKIVTKN